MTKTINYYIDGDGIENLFIISIDEYNYDFLPKPKFEVRYKTSDSNARFKILQQNVETLESALEIVDLYLDYIKRISDVTRISKQTIIHEDVKL